MPAFELTINNVNYLVQKAIYQNKENGIQVREAIDLSCDAQVAVKFLPWPSSSRKGEKFHGFLMDEINAMKALRQVNGDFVQLLNFQEKLHHNGSDWAVLVMPLYWGSLKKLNLKKLGSEEVLSLLHRLAVAVQTMHKRGVVHRDLKLANVCVDRHFNPYIVDFGHAIMCSPTKTLTEYPIGTRGCRCPEYVKNYTLIKEGKKPKDRSYNAERFDVFSLGVMFFQILSGGSYPFTRAESTDARYKHLMTKDYDVWWNLQDLRCKRKIPEEARDLIQGMLHADAKERFTMAQVVNHRFFGEEEEVSPFLQVEKPAFAAISSGASNRSSENMSPLPSVTPCTSMSRPRSPSFGNNKSAQSKLRKISMSSRFFSFIKGEKKEKALAA